MDLEQIRAFMAGSEEIRFEGRNREEIYNWVRQTAIEQRGFLRRASVGFSSMPATPSEPRI